jgi:hypothetical protein
VWRNLRRIYQSALGDFKPAVEIGWTLIEISAANSVSDKTRPQLRNE